MKKIIFVLLMILILFSSSANAAPIAIASFKGMDMEDGYTYLLANIILSCYESTTNATSAKQIRFQLDSDNPDSWYQAIIDESIRKCNEWGQTNINANNIYMINFKPATQSFLNYPLTVDKGGTGLGGIEANQVWVGTGADTVATKALSSCSNGTTSKLLYNTSTNEFSCGTDQTGSGGSMPKVITSNITNSTTTPTNITGLSWSLAANTEYGFMCVVNHLGTATSGPRFNLNGPASPTLVGIEYRRGTSATAETISRFTAFSAAAQTAAVTTSGVTTQMTSHFSGVIINGSNAGTAQFMLTSSTSGQTVTVYRGSYCTVY